MSLKALAERTDIALCKLILERRGVVKLISTYIDVLPALARHWPDGRIRYKLNSVGTDTGRFLLVVNLSSLTVMSL